MNTNRLVVLFSLCSLVVWLAGAQNYQLRPFTIEDGLPQSQVYDLVQDAEGYLWLGTQGGGLARFDGKNFEVYNEQNGLSSNYIHALAYKNDTLFVGTKNGLNVKVKDSIKRFPSAQVNTLFINNGRLLVGTQNGLYRFTKREGLLKMELPRELLGASINQIAFDGEHYWLATKRGLWQLLLRPDGTSNYEAWNRMNTTSVLFHDGHVYAASFNEGIFVFDADNKESVKYLNDPVRINSISIQQKNELWVATDNDGILIYNIADLELQKRLDTKGGLAVPHVRTVKSDAQQNIWIATSGGGFYRYFQNNFNHFDKDTGLKGNRVYAVQPTENALWLASAETGLSYIDSLGIHHLDPIPNFSNVKIKTIDSDIQNAIWAGSDGKGLLLHTTIERDSIIETPLDSTTIKKEIVRIKTSHDRVFRTQDGLPSNWIRKVICDGKQTWVATYSDGVVALRYNAKIDSLQILKQLSSKEGFIDLLINDIALDNYKQLWYSTQDGNIGYIARDSIVRLGRVLDEEVAIGTLLFHEDKLFIGTAGKGVWYSTLDQSPRFRKLKGSSELTSENVYQLQFDNQGQLWVGSEKGVDKIRLNAAGEIEELIHFGRNDGFLAIETCLNAVAKDAEGHLWFGGIYGLTTYTPSEETVVKYQPIVQFEHIEMDYRLLDSIDPNMWSKARKVLQLKPDQNQLAFSYRTVDINHPGEIYYRTRLNDKDWGPWSKEGRQNLVGLAYGDHTFQVQSRNYQMMESAPIAFHFFIETPIYQQLWFQWTLFGLLILILGGGVLLYIRRIKARNRAVQQQLELQNYLLSLEQKALRLQMNPHFIFNVLNGIKAMAMSNPQKMNETIIHFAQLLRENLYNSRKDSIGLDQELKTLEHYIEVELLMTPKPFTYSLTCAPEVVPEELLIPPMLVQPFVENAVRHGILKSEREGALKISFYTDESFLFCKIEDNGPGIFVSQNSKVKTDHQSMALEVTQERLVSLSGEDALQIKELKTATGEVVGTQIVLKLPLQTDY